MCDLGHPILGYICHHVAPEYFKNWNDPSQIWKGKESIGFGLRGKRVSLVLHFACFVFASVFISDGESGRVCQASVSMQAIISAPFEVCACVWVCMHVCVRYGTGVCCMDVGKYRRVTRKRIFWKCAVRIKLVLTQWGLQDIDGGHMI